MAPPIGIYIHIPFCTSKCPYCDFYSLPAGKETMGIYVRRVCEELRRWGNRLCFPADTLYFGGGTPSLLEGEHLAAIIAQAREIFGLEGAEITLECNPSHDLSTLLPLAAQAGVNRISLGLQSAVHKERLALGRKASAEDVLRGIHAAHRYGIHNISLDVMLAIPGQTQETLRETIAFCTSADVSHISAYLLKLEENTPFFAQKKDLALPDEEETCSLYLSACRLLENAGFHQYEISNFSLPGKESRHNLKYWNGEPYLGIGPAAHSFIGGRRFYYPRDLSAFCSGSLPAVADGTGGSFEEYAMLRLRLTQGLVEQKVIARFGHPIPPEMRRRCAPFAEKGLVLEDGKGIRFTKEGFLLSNALIGALLIQE